MKKSQLTAVVLFIFILSAFKSDAQIDSVKIITSSLCSTCKKKIEHELSFEKGVKESVVNVETKELTVVYDSKKTNPEKLRIAVTKIGYDADSLKADQKAFNRLPECCKDPDAHH